MSEGDLVRAIIDALTLRGATVWRCNSGKVRVRGAYLTLAPEGTPDVIGYTRHGRFVGIEVKLPKGRVTKEQLDWHAAARAHGAIAGVAYCVEDALEMVG